MIWPIALIAAGAYAAKRWFDMKKAAPGSTSETGYGAMPPQDAGGGASQGGGGGGGSAGPYDPGYPMSTDPTYAPQPPLTLSQQAKAFAAITQPKIITTAERAASPTASTFTARAASIPSTYLASGPTPAPAPSPFKVPVVQPATTAVATILKPKTLTGKTF